MYGVHSVLHNLNPSFETIKGGQVDGCSNGVYYLLLKLIEHDSPFGGGNKRSQVDDSCQSVSLDYG